MRSIHERFRDIRIVGMEKDFFEDIYHQVLVMSWARFFLLYALFFIAFNLFFGFLFWLDPAGVSGTAGDFFQDFSFSVQTFSTIGYGVFAPSDTYAHALIVTESLFSVIFTALLTGLAFSKFARPKARVRFTDKVVITTYNGKRTLMFRLANLRGNQIAEASIRAIALKSETSSEGYTMRVQKDINFVRNTSSFFILSWTVMHIIDEQSPFFGLSADDIISQNIEMSVSVIGHDETFSQSVHAACIYAPQDFVFDKRFADLFVSSQGKAIELDYTRFDVILD